MTLFKRVNKPMNQRLLNFCMIGFILSPCLIACAVVGTDDTPAPSGSNDHLIADLGINMKPIKAGTFNMGDPKKAPFEVTISWDFWIGQTEVTQAQYEKMMGNNPSVYPNEPNCPVESVSWTNAMAFCDKLTELDSANIPEGYGYRLPTEAEWEYCCRAGTTTTFCFGEGTEQSPTFSDYGWCETNSDGHPHHVQKKLPNAWGLYDMHGNVLEWCIDWRNKDLPTTPKTNPKGPDKGVHCIRRGGSWTRGEGSCKAYNRGYGKPTNMNPNLGFRVLLAPSLVEK